MEPQLKPHHSMRCQDHQRSGVALILVLLILSLITLMVVSMLVTVSSENVTSKSQAASAETRRLSDKAVQIVMSQIRDATLGVSGGNTSDVTKTWASQPGMLRVYDNNGGGSNGRAAMTAAYKLYSSDTMVVNGSSFDPVNDWAPANWDSQPAIYTDLNSPVIDSNNNKTYPVVDPAAVTLNQPDPFNLTGLPTLVDGCSIDSTAAPVMGKSNSVPMPVKWLYVLKDGEVLPPGSGSTGTQVNIVGAVNPLGQPYTVNGVTLTNEIVGRIAFWTDDDTCKLNINTAGEAAPWIPPRYDTSQDVALALYQPTGHEYNRIGGHPATTCLSPVFWKIFGLQDPNESLLAMPGTGNYDMNAGDPAPQLTGDAQTYFKKLYGTSTAGTSLIPRGVYSDLGSQQGTVATAGITTPGITNASLTNFRLYADIDELAFAAPSPPYTTRPINAGLTPAQVAQLRFFLTTNSRAPEVNLFHQPRVSVWPIPDWTNGAFNPENSHMLDTVSPFDQLIAFCSTLGGSSANKKYSYIFGRFDPTDPTHDYLQGSGYLYGTTQPSTARNPQVFKYLRSQLNKAIPGYGSSFSSRADLSATKCDELTTLFFDYIRSCVNLCDSSAGSGVPAAGSGPSWFQRSYTAQPSFATYASGGVTLTVNQGTGLVAPTQITPNGTPTHGMGRFPVLKSVTLLFSARYADQPPVEVDPTTRLPTAGNIINTMHPFYVTSNHAPPFLLSDRYPSFPKPILATTTNGQTHAGLRYLSEPDQRPATVGRYDLPNTLYNNPTALNLYQTKMEGAIIVDLENIAPGSIPMGAGYQITITSAGPFSCGAGSLTFTSNNSLNIKRANYLSTLAGNIGIRGTAFDSFNGGAGSYPFISTNQVVVGGAGVGGPHGDTFNFGGGTVIVKLSYLPPTGAPVTVSTSTVTFPADTFPTPKLITYHGATQVSVVDTGPPPTTTSTTTINTAGSAATVIQPGQQYLSSRFNPTTSSSSVVSGTTTTTTTVAGPGGTYTNTNGMFIPETNGMTNMPGSKLSADTWRSVECAYGDMRLVAGMPTANSTSLYIPHSFYTQANGQFTGNDGATYLIRNAHTLRGNFSSDYMTPGCTARYLNDYAAGNSNITPTLGAKDPFNYFFANSTFNAFNVNSIIPIKWDYALPYSGGIGSGSGEKTRYPDVTSTTDFNDGTFLNIWHTGGDFDTCTGDSADGGFINKADEGQRTTTVNYGADVPYMGLTSSIPTGGALFSPIRQIPSAVMFGSLPSGLDPVNPDPTKSSWHTLQFSPNPNNLDKARTVYNNPPDYLLLDLFQMPVVEPYAISGPVSTAGKVNMNYQIAPFSYLTRNTALRGVLKSVFITAVNDQFINLYKMDANNLGIKYSDSGGSYDAFGANSGNFYFHYPVHVNETLRQFNYRFSTQKDLFHSPAEICNIWLYPAKQPTPSSPTASATPLVSDGSGYDYSNMSGSAIWNWWYGSPGTARKGNTADNVRERPYAELYPRLTTQSNTYTVHYRVQLLKKSPGTAAATWVEPTAPGSAGTHDVILGEYRGSTSIERYVDPNDSTIPDFASNAALGSTSSTYNLDTYYKFRIVSNRRFAP